MTVDQLSMVNHRRTFVSAAKFQVTVVGQLLHEVFESSQLD